MTLEAMRDWERDLGWGGDEQERDQKHVTRTQLNHRRVRVELAKLTQTRPSFKTLFPIHFFKPPHIPKSICRELERPMKNFLWLAIDTRLRSI